MRLNFRCANRKAVARETTENGVGFTQKNVELGKKSVMESGMTQIKIVE